MIRDFLTYDGDGTIHCDVCIAGAGAAGITLALALASHGWHVVLLESGGLEFEPETQDLYAGRNIGRSYFDLDATRLRYLGGSTNHWGGMCAPFDERDFQVRPWVPHSGWPIARADLEPYYPAAHEILDLGPFDYDPARLASTPLPAFDPGLIVPRVFRFSVPATMLGEKYRDALDAAANLAVLLHANLTDIELSRPGGPVEAFLATALDGRHVRIHARGFVIALGGIENARMLLNADRVQPGGIGNDHDLVGRFFMDHPGIAVGSAIIVNQAWKTAYLQHRHEGTEIRHAVAPSDAVQADAAILNIAAIFGEVWKVRPYAKGYTALRELKDQLRAWRWPDKLGHHLWQILTDLGGVVEGLQEKMDPTTYVTVESEQAPNPDSRVVLEHERDRLGLRRVALDWRLSEIDHRTMRVLAETLGREFGRLEIGRVQLAEWLLDANGWPDDLIGGNHHMGTTRMADDPRRGVVDRDCRVFGCANLFVAGSSVFPTSGFANPTVNLVALTLRLADHLQVWLDGERPLSVSTELPGL